MFLIGLAEVCCWSWLGGIVLLDDLRLGCHSLVLGVGADITSYYFLLTRVADGDAWFSGCVESAYSILSGFLVRRRMS